MTIADLVEMTYLPLPISHTVKGEPRRVGLELEFCSLSLPTAARLVAEHVGCSAPNVTRGRIAARVASRWGDFRVELDWKAIQEGKHLLPLRALGVASSSCWGQAVEDALVGMVDGIVPMELVTPPIPWEDLSSLDSLWQALRDAGAADTRSGVLRGFGLHLNPELEGGCVEEVVASLQAYMLLEDWLVEELAVVRSRRVLPFIEPFPDAYRELVLSPEYEVDWTTFIRDYAKHNPTRNRRLDLWPLIAHMTNDEFADSVADWDLVKPRPAFHYRLPNSEVSKPGWTPAKACNSWVWIEKLARDRAMRGQIAKALRAMRNFGGQLGRKAWIHITRAYVREIAAAP